MSTQLTIRQPGKPAQIATFNGSALVGRDEGCDVTVPIHFVSRHHLRIEPQPDGYRVTDLSSTNGTRLNGELIRPNSPTPLRNGDILRIGDNDGNTVGLQFSGAPQRGNADSATQYVGEVDLQPQKTIRIGRTAESDLQLDHPSVSRRHAEISGDVLRDLGSANGTYVNGSRISGTHTLRAGDTVQIGTFRLEYDAGRLVEYSPEGNYRIDAFGLERTVKVGGKPLTILHDVNLSIYPKEFVAVVGGSGAGKSTLLKTLNGFSPANEGTVLINGDDLYESFDAYRSIIGYVPQDDIIHLNLTVDEALRYAAKIRLPDAQPDEITARLDKVLDQVEMTDHRAKLVKNLSGGQRKRVSISAELLADPGLFFLDEPTSGLDPGLEKKMMYTLRRLADSGRTVLLITHATANIEQCTHVIFLARGRVAYYGPPSEALEFFGASDFADIYTRLSLPPDQVGWPAQFAAPAQKLIQQGHDVATIWQALYKLSPQYKTYVQERLSDRNQTRSSHVNVTTQGANVGFFEQFGVLSKRYFNLIRRDRLSLIILLAVMPIIGLLLLLMTDEADLVGQSADAIGDRIQRIITAKINRGDTLPVQSIYQIAGNTERVIFIMALAAALLGLFAAAYEIIKEAAIYQRERLVNLKISSYLASKIIPLSVFALIQCALLLVVLSIKVEFPTEGVFLGASAEMYITLVLATLASLSLGLLISALVRNASTVIYAILVVVFVQILFAGVIFPIPDAAEPISYLTTTRWTVEALGDTAHIRDVIALGGGCLEADTPALANIIETESAYCTDAQLAIDAGYFPNLSYDSTTGHLTLRWLVLLAYSLICLGVTGVVQKRKDVI